MSFGRLLNNSASLIVSSEYSTFRVIDDPADVGASPENI